MLTQSKKLLNAVKKLYTKVTGGKTTKSNDLPTVIDSMAENYVGGSGGGALYLHRIYLGNPTECDRIDFTMNIYNSRPEPYTNIQDLEAYLISAGLNNTAEEIETYENHNGIICARDPYSSSSETIILRKIDEHYWYFRVGQYDNSYLGINIWEDSVMTM